MSLQYRLYRFGAPAGQIAGYGLHGSEILVANDNGPEENTQIVAKIKEDFTRAVIIADNRDITAAQRELNLCAEALAHPYHYINHTKYRDYGHFLNGFETQINNRFAVPLHERKGFAFTNLQNDIARTIDDLGPLFNRNAGFEIMLRYFSGTLNEGGWHVDANIDADEIAVIRSLSPIGTIIAYDEKYDCHKQFSLDGHHPLKGGHAAQSINIIKKGTVHKTPASPAERWIYRINQSRCP